LNDHVFKTTGGLEKFELFQQVLERKTFDAPNSWSMNSKVGILKKGIDGMPLTENIQPHVESIL